MKLFYGLILLCLMSISVSETNEEIIKNNNKLIDKAISKNFEEIKEQIEAIDLPNEACFKNNVFNLPDLSPDKIKLYYDVKKELHLSFTNLVPFLSSKIYFNYANQNLKINNIKATLNEFNLETVVKYQNLNNIEFENPTINYKMNLTGTINNIPVYSKKFLNKLIRHEAIPKLLDNMKKIIKKLIK